MRWFEIINEQKIRLDDSETILKNPILSELKNFIKKCAEQSVRGYTNGRNVFVWDAMYSTHYEMDIKLSVTNILDSASFFIALDKNDISPTWQDDGKYREIEEVNGLFISTYAKMSSGSKTPYDIPNFQRMLGLKIPIDQD